MVCGINIISNCSRAFSCKRPNTPTFKGNPLSQLTSDVCQFSKRKYSQSELLEILRGDFRKLSKSFLDSLTDEDYKFCVNYAKSDEKYWINHSIPNEDVRDISRYCDILMRGINKIAPNKKVKFVSIGQSPAIFANALSLRGIDTAIIPISRLQDADDKITKIASSQDFANYISYLKKHFNIDLDNLDKDTTYIFTDFSYTGGSLANFKKLLMAKKYYGENTKVLSLQNINVYANPTPKEYEFTEKFSSLNLMSPYLKFLYSPIFKMPLDDLSNIAQWHAKSQCATTRRGNKLQVLLYDYQKHPDKYVSQEPELTLEEKIEKNYKLIEKARLIVDWWEK